MGFDHGHKLDKSKGVAWYAYLVCFAFVYNIRSIITAVSLLDANKYSTVLFRSTVQYYSGIVMALTWLLRSLYSQYQSSDHWSILKVKYNHRADVAT
jgi:hypothetical protein